MTTYFEQLKEKHDNPKKAYVEYQLSKKYLRVFAHAKDLPEDIAISMDLQEKLNKYAEALVENYGEKRETSFGDFFNVERKDLPKFLGKYLEHFSFLGIDRSEIINLATGMYEINLTNAAKSINWESLEDVIKADNNNTPTIDKNVASKLLAESVDEYGLQSITVGQVRITNECLNKIPESLNQLSLVIGCEKKQVGANKFNFCFDSEDCNYAGYSNNYFGCQKVYLNERISYDAFAHEWLHSIDSMLATHNKLDAHMASESNFKSISDLLGKSIEPNADAINKAKEKVEENCLTSLHNIIHRFDQTGALTNTDKFIELIDQEYIKALDNKWDKEDFIKKAQDYQKDRNASIPYLCSEIELLQKVKNEKLDVSIFYKYAIIMDDNLKLTKIMDSDYSITECEMFARAFETFTEIKLQEKGVKNIISKSINNYTPNHHETLLYMDKWDAVTSDIREMLNVVCPVKQKEKENNFEVSKVLANINNVMNKIKEQNAEPALVTNKLKIGG